MMKRYPVMRRLTRAELLPMALICLVLISLMVGFYDNYFICGKQMGWCQNTKTSYDDE
jgi:hypothetical protein